MTIDLDNLLNNTLEEFLLQCVSDKVEEVSDAFAENYSESESRIHIQYELNFILQTFIHSKVIWRVQGCAQAELSIPDNSQTDWFVFDGQNDDFFEHYEKYKDLVSFHNVTYEEMECDTLSA